MKTLYVSDLDGTLLRSDISTSDFTNRTINDLVGKGMLFSYATARSYVTSVKVTKGLDARIPLIVYNGAFVIDNVTGEIMISNFFGGAEAAEILDDLIAHDVYPIVYAMIGGVEKFSYVPEKCTKGMREFVDSRAGDPRDNPVSEAQDLYRGEIFYFTCIDDAKKLEPLWRKYEDRLHAVFQKDIYSGEQWLELMPAAASKSNAIRQLKQRLDCDRLVVFGDGRNDIDMFQMADEAYAVENAVDDLKKIATGVIESNDNDGVAKWLVQNAAADGAEPRK